MNQVKLLTVLCFVCTISLCAREQARSFKLSYETFCISTINSSKEYGILDNFDSGCHKTIMRVHDYPYGKEFVMRWKRPLFKKKRDVVRRLTLSQLFDNAEKMEQKTPMMVLSSRGFLPGEVITFSLMTPDGYVKSEKVELTPHPLVVTDRNYQATVTAELSSLIPTVYKVRFDNFEMNERVKFTGVSEDTQVGEWLTLQDGYSIVWVPAVPTLKGGTAVLSVERLNGEELLLPVIWGDAMIPHLKGHNSVVNTNFGVMKSIQF